LQSLLANQEKFSMISPLLILPVIKKLTSES